MEHIFMTLSQHTFSLTYGELIGRSTHGVPTAEPDLRSFVELVIINLPAVAR